MAIEVGDISDISDELCVAFVAGVEKVRTELKLTAFEAAFVTNNVARGRTKYTDKQKEVVRRMIEKYKGKIEY
jgi:hypothetical protein